ncbi:MAG: nitrilase-related carbon-nitrogen hydrolase, partial [Bacteroidota bacterium]
FNKANHEGLLSEKSILVLPEHLGSWLVAANERKTVYTSDNIDAATRAVAVRNILGFLPEYLSASEANKARAALFRLKSVLMAQIYSNVLKTLAKKYSVTILGGSIILPNPMIEDDSLILQDGPLYNSSIIFYNDGSMDSNISKKAFPVMDEQGFLEPAKSDELRVYETPAGKLAVVICADSWYPATYDQIKSQGASLLAIPSYATPSGIWSSKWQGYNGASNPLDVDQSDIDNITEEMAWLKYSMGGRAQQAGVQHGINVFLRGDLWDLGDDGSTISWQKGGLKVSDSDTEGAITCLWF